MEKPIKLRLQVPEKSVQAGEPVRLQLIPYEARQPELVLPLEEMHERSYHLLIVSEDLQFFAHEHPYKTERGYTLSFRFPFGGKFILFSDIKPEKQSAVVLQNTLSVSGEPPKEQLLSVPKLEDAEDGLGVSLYTKPGGELALQLEKNGKPLSAHTLDNYLGAKAHVVMIEKASKAFLHVHPLLQDDQLALHTHIPHPGLYRLWVQLQYEGKLYLFDFSLPVDSDTGMSSTKHTTAHPEHALH